MLVSAVDILPSISRREEQVFVFFPPPPFLFLITRENARGVALSLETTAREPRILSLFSCTRTRVDDYVSEVALPNVITDGNSDLLGMDVKRVLFSFSLFVSFFFLILPRTFIYTRLNRIDGSADRADRNIDLTR